MKPLSRRSLLWAAGATIFAPWSRAQTFPFKPLKIVVPNAAGGAADITARTVGQKLSEALGQPVVIDNRASAGGIVAGELVAKTDSDGHTMLLISSGTAVSASLFKSMPFDTLKDFAPVSKLASFDLVLCVAEGGRFKSLSELLDYGRNNPGKLNIGTPQAGTTQNLAAELFLASSGLQAQIVPFNGTPPVITALRGGNLDAMVEILGPVMSQIKSGALRPVAVLSDKRGAALPDVPAVREAGGNLASFNVSSWNGLAVPAKTPREVVVRLNQELQTILAMSEVKARLSELSLYAQGSTPEQAVDILQADIRRWADVIARAKIEKK
ncbi:MAG: tripartite tricarboxylate transporter substrate binding protein [Alphaproteobacteria bacterium]|nr:tripartite tricarboxylate transporter substrate binding protein [Alphaproteobacteria bacterium]